MLIAQGAGMDYRTLIGEILSRRDPPLQGARAVASRRGPRRAQRRQRQRQRKRRWPARDRPRRLRAARGQGVEPGRAGEGVSSVDHGRARPPRRGSGPALWTCRWAASARAASTPSPTWRACAWATPPSSPGRDLSGPGKGPVRTGVTAIVPGAGNIFMERLARRRLRAQRRRRGLGPDTGDGVGTCWRRPSSSPTPCPSASCPTRWPASWWSENPGIGDEHDVIIPVVGECDDSWLNDIAGRHVREEHVRAARRPRRPGARWPRAAWAPARGW